jgi:hypothetical protein
MKYIYMLFAWLLLSNEGTSQITLTPISMNANVDINGEKIFYFTLNNGYSEYKLYWWKVEKPNGFPEGWQTVTCDGLNCYLENFDKNPCSKPDTIHPNIPRQVKVTFYPNGVSGEANICFKIFADCNLQNELASTDCNDILSAGTSSVVEENASAQLLYPNPTNEKFKIANDGDVTNISIYNSFGNLLLRESHYPNKIYDISKFNKGIYFVSVESIGKTNISKLVFE